MDGFREFLDSPWTELVQWSIALGALYLSWRRLGYVKSRDRRADLARLRERLNVATRGGEIVVEFTPVDRGAHHRVHIKSLGAGLRLVSCSELIVDQDYDGPIYADPLPNGRRDITIDMSLAHYHGRGNENGTLIASCYALGEPARISLAIEWHDKRQVTQKADVRVSADAAITDLRQLRAGH